MQHALEIAKNVCGISLPAHFALAPLYPASAQSSSSEIFERIAAQAGSKEHPIKPDYGELSNIFPLIEGFVARSEKHPRHVIDAMKITIFDGISQLNFEANKILQSLDIPDEHRSRALCQFTVASFVFCAQHFNSASTDGKEALKHFAGAFVHSLYEHSLLSVHISNPFDVIEGRLLRLVSGHVTLHHLYKEFVGRFAECANHSLVSHIKLLEAYRERNEQTIDEKAWGHPKLSRDPKEQSLAVDLLAQALTPCTTQLGWTDPFEQLSTLLATNTRMCLSAFPGYGIEDKSSRESGVSRFFQTLRANNHSAVLWEYEGLVVNLTAIIGESCGYQSVSQIHTQITSYLSLDQPIKNFIRYLGVTPVGLNKDNFISIAAELNLIKTASLESSIHIQPYLIDSTKRDPIKNTPSIFIGFHPVQLSFTPPPMPVESSHASPRISSWPSQLNIFSQALFKLGVRHAGFRSFSCALIEVPDMTSSFKQIPDFEKYFANINEDIRPGWHWVVGSIPDDGNNGQAKMPLPSLVAS